VRISQRFIYGAVCLGSLAFIGAGFSVSSRGKIPASLRPAPAATDVIGNTTGPLLYVQNNGTSAFNTYGVAGTAGVGPYAIGVLGYGANSSAPNLALTGYDIGPGSVAAVGEAAYPEPAAGPGSTKTTGVLGIAPDGDGVMGQTSVQHGCCYVFGSASTSDYAGVVGVDNASSGENAGVVGMTSGGLYGVEGISSDGAVGGVEAVGTDGNGLDAYSTTGAGVFSKSTSGIAVDAVSSSNDAVDATTAAGDGVSALSSGSGFAGVYADSTGSAGYGVYATGVHIAVSGQSSSGYPFVGSGSSGVVFFVDHSGDLYYAGTLSTAVATPHGTVGRMYVPKSTMQTMEDFGSGSLVNGSGTVHLDASFAQMMDGTGYQVFLTPEGDCNGLYIAQKNASSFVVRELHAGHASLAFDYRIVARQYGHSSDRASIAQSTAAFGLPHAAAPPASRPAAHASASNRRNGASLPNPYALPRAASGLSLTFGH
jgi:hypothetical protein